MDKKKCPVCDGDGSITVNDTDPYGYGPDPQCDEVIDCPTCFGEGEVECDGWEVGEIGYSQEHDRYAER